MNNLKSAYELASQRIILSQFAVRQEKQAEKEKKEEQNRIDSLPDFVVEWENRQKEDWDDRSIVERTLSEDIKDAPTKLLTSSEIEKIQKEKTTMRSIINKTKHKQEREQENNDLAQVKIVEPETISYADMPEVHWYGHFTSYSGFSRMNRAMAFGLSNKGAKVKLDIQSCALEINEATQRQLEILETTEISPKAPKVYGATIPLSMMHYGRKILYTMMETSETLHKDYVERLNLFDEIWVPTKHGANLFKSNGVTRPIMVMPLGVDIERYNSNKTPYDFGSDLNQFVFLSVFKWGYRKGYDILLKAYMDEFSAEDNVSLVLATRCETDPNPNRISEDLAYLRSGVDKQDEELPHIVLYTKHFAEKDMPRIYNSSNAFALISRGEGFGLPYYEAASCGLPIIGSKCSGHGDLLNETNSYVVEPASYAKAKVNGYMSRLAKHCRFYEDQMFPEFGDDAILKTRQHMRYVYENYSEAVKKAKVLQKIVRDNYSWDMAINRVLTRVKELN